MRGAICYRMMWTRASGTPCGSSYSHLKFRQISFFRFPRFRWVFVTATKSNRCVAQFAIILTNRQLLRRLVARVMTNLLFNRYAHSAGPGNEQSAICYRQRAISNRPSMVGNSLKIVPGSFELVPSCLKCAPRLLKIHPSWLQFGSSRLQGESRGLKLAPGSPKLVPTWSRDGPS